MGARRTGRHFWTVAGALGALSTGVVGFTGAGLVATTAPAAAQAAPLTITLDPAEDLVDGTPVTVAVTGLPANEDVVVAQCPSSAGTLYGGGCEDFVYGGADSTGAATLPIRVDAILQFYGEDDELEELDCRQPDLCMIGLSTDDGESVTASAPLHFAADGPLAAPPVVSVTPDHDVSDLQAVSVQAEGLVWTDQAEVVQCVANPTSWSDCDFETLIDVQLDAGATSLTVDYTASAVVYTTNQGTADCRVPDTCVVVVTQDFLDTAQQRGAAPITFDPETDVIVPTLSVTPHMDLVDGQIVTVEGADFRGDWIELLQCAGRVEPTWESCQWLDAYAQLEDGAFSLEAEVMGWLSTDTGSVDCRTSEDPCLLVAAGGFPSSPRAGRAELRFDPDAPLLPGPEISVDPSTDLADEALVTVSGETFEPDGFAYASVCRHDALTVCDPQSTTSIRPDDDGAFSVEIAVAARFTADDGSPVDCRTSDGCSVVAQDGPPRRRQATAPLEFGPSQPPEHRYFDPVFDDVTVTRDVPFRDTVDATGHPVQLTLDVYQPTGDQAGKRPAMVWMPGGWFGPGEEDPGADVSAMADAFARRGYVAVVMRYRQRPEMNCCPARDATAVTEALLDGAEDAAAGVDWLHHHAGEYRIDPEAITLAGVSAGAANAFGVAYPADPSDPGHPGHPGPGHPGHEAAAAVRAESAPSEPSAVAAIVAVSGVSLGRPAAAGAPPVLALHGDDDQRAPLHLSEQTCRYAEEVGSRCQVVAYPGIGHDVAARRQRDIVRRTAEFVGEAVLEPLGYLEEPPHQHPTTSTTHDHGSTTSTSQQSGATTTTTRHQHGGDLPRTGSDAFGLIRTGLALATAGGLLVLAAQWRRRRALLAAGPDLGGDDDRGGIALAGTAVLALALGAALVLPRAAEAQEEPPVTTAPGATTSTTHDHGTTTSSTTTSSSTTSTTHGHGTTTTSQPGGTTTTLPPHDPGFPPEWTPEQVAFAQGLIDDTEVALDRYANPAILPLLGFVWIGDGIGDQQYQHWVNTGWITDGLTLDPAYPESLVFRNDADGPVLEAAMYMLGLGHNMGNIPSDIVYLPGWHIHTNLCFEGLRLVGIAVNGVCERGSILIPPPMLHVWNVDTPCGRFAGVDENGLQCEHPHD